MTALLSVEHVLARCGRRGRILHGARLELLSFADKPTNAMEGLEVTFCLNLAEIGPALELLARRTAHFETGLEVAVRTLRDRAALLARLTEQSSRNPGTREFLVNELASLRRNLQSIDDLLKAAALSEK